jgi:predicted Zn-dependent protease
LKLFWLFFASCTAAVANPSTDDGGPFQDLLHLSLNKHFEFLASQDEPAYYLSYTVTHSETVRLTAVEGLLGENEVQQHRLLDVDLRVGSMELDNTHRQQGLWGVGKHFSAKLPIDGHALATQAILWRETDEAYVDASDQMARIRGANRVRVEESDSSGDFGPAEIYQHTSAPSELDLDLEALKKDLVSVSAVFLKWPEILESRVSLVAENTWVSFVSSEGARLFYPHRNYRIGLQAWMRAEDGTDIALFDGFDALDPEDLPDLSLLERRAEALAERVVALEKAPELEPFTGPIILSGKAAGVFFHEVLGHRVEGHRQKDADEGQTFTAKVGEKILPEFLSIWDDPTQRDLEGVPLVGHYEFDAEGSRAEAVKLVEDGVLRSFLMGRSPISGFPVTNGHGRREPGKAAVSRQGNLMIRAKNPKSDEVLREMLIRETKRQGREYALIVDSIQGGFTLTGRDAPNSFQVTPDYAWKVFVDGRPDELVRGVDLIGTPLVTFERIMAAGESVGVFNGRCGAESGWVPVSASSPALLLSEIEVQKKGKGSALPLILPAPELKAAP